jgi:5-methylthioadenosine/S-adenosylhomocysteine deaminase
MAEPSVLLRAAWVLPMATRPIENGCVIVSGDTIDFVGSFHDAPKSVPVVDLGDAAIMPGLVNVHTHLELTAMRHALEGLDFFEWIRTLTRIRKDVLSSSGDVRASARVGIAEGLTRGITTYADTASMGASVLEGLRDMQVRGIVYQESFGPDPDPFTTVEPAIRRLRQQVAEMRGRQTDMVRVGISPHAPYSVSVPLYKTIGTWAAQQNLPVAVHLAESEAEHRFVKRGEGPFADYWRERHLDPAASKARSPIALLDQSYILRLKPLVIHAVHMDSEDAYTLARHGCPIAHCPVSNARFGHGIAPWLLWREHSLTVAIGTDSVAANNRMDVLGEARIAQLLACGYERTAAAMGTATALKMATLNGAAALGIREQAGAILPGYQADLAVWPLDGWSARPVRDPYDILVHGLAGGEARMTMVAGQVLWQEGRHLHYPRRDEDRGRIDRLGRQLMEARATCHI